MVGLLALSATESSGLQECVIGEPCLPEEGVNYAVVVGVSRYDSLPDQDQLQFAHRDAEGFARFVLSGAMGEFRPANVRLFTNPTVTIETLSAESPTREKVMGWIRTLSRTRSKEGDRVVIYLAGHADVEYEDTYVLLSDVSKEGNYTIRGGMPFEFVQKEITAMARRGVQVVLITDACRVPGPIGEERAQEIAAAALESKATHDLMITKFASSKARELSAESDSLGGGHGLFTHFLLEGLWGAAADDEGHVDAMDLQRFVRDTVFEHSGKRQDPQMSGNDRAILAQLTEEHVRLPLLATAASAEPLDDSGPRQRALTPRNLEALGDTTTENLIRRFGRAVGRGELVPPPTQLGVATTGDTSAWALYHQLIERLSPRHRADAHYTMSVSLAEAAASVLYQYLRGGNDQPADSVYRSAARNLQYLEELLGEADASIETQRLFLQAYVIIRREERPRYEEAMRGLRRALDLDPDAAYVHNALGMAHLDLNELGEAERYFRRAAELAPKWVYPRNNMGIVRDRQSRYGEAIAEYEAAIELHPDTYHAYNNMGNVFWDLGRFVEAEQWYRRSMVIAPDRGLPHSNLASLYRTKGRLRDAVEEARIGIRLDSLDANRPYWAWPWLVLGFVEAERANNGESRGEAAEAAFRNAIERAPFQARPYAELGDYLREQNRYEEAESAYRTAVENDPTFAWSYWGLGWLMRDIGLEQAGGSDRDSAFDAAELVFQEAIGRAARPAVAWTNLGDYQLWRGQASDGAEKTRHLERAVSSFQSAIDIDSLRLTAYYGLSEVSRERGQTDAAIGWLRSADRVSRISPSGRPAIGSPVPLNRLGELYAGLATEAGNAGDAAAQAEALELAIDAFRGSIATDSTYPSALGNLGRLYVESGDPIRAAPLYTQAYSFGFSNRQDRQYVSGLRLAAAQLAGSDPAGAIEIYEAALALDPSQVLVMDRIARLLHGQGRLEQAALRSDSSRQLVTDRSSRNWRSFTETRIAIALDRGEVPLAQDLLSAVDPEGSDRGLRLARAMVLFEAGDTAGAIAAYAGAMEAAADDADTAEIWERYDYSPGALERLRRIHDAWQSGG